MANVTPFILVELDLDTCSLSYGVAPCTAAVPATGTTQCFNTFATCQDRPNYTRTTKTYRFTNGRIDTLQGPGDPPTMPTVIGVQMAPTRLTPREGLGTRASITVELTDHVFNDSGVDKYLLTRLPTPVNWENRSTFWRRLLARTPNWENRVMRVTTGIMDDETSVYDLPTVRMRTYLIQSISGPDSQGRVSITAKDPLRLADNDRSVWPKRSTVKLVGNVLAAATTLTVYDTADRISLDVIAGQPYIRIDEEIMLVTAAVAAVPPDQWTLTVTRATMPAFYPSQDLNVASDHKDGSSIQSCWLFDTQTFPQAFYTLLATGAGIDPSYLPIADWNQEMLDAGADTLRVSALIAESKPVKDLLTELTQHDINLWWDDRAAVIKLRPVRVFPTEVATWDERQNIIADSVEVAVNSRSRISEAWLYYGHRWPLSEMNKLESFNRVEVVADLESEGPDSFGSAAIQETRSRWFTTSQQLDANSIGARTVLRYRYGKVGMAMSVDQKDSAPWTGDTVGAYTAQIVDQLGVMRKTLVTLLEAEESWSEAGYVVRYVAEGQILGVLLPEIREGDITLDAQQNYDTATGAEKDANAFICNDDGFFPSDGKPGYTMSG